MSSPFTAARAAAERMTIRPGLIAALVCLCVYGALALTVDFPRAALGIQSDEATYYMMGHSLAEDGDLTYRYGGSRPGLARVSHRARRRVPQEGTDDRRGAPRSAITQRALLTENPSSIRCLRGAVREAVRDQRLSRPPRDSARAGRVVRLPVPARARSRSAVRAAGDRLRDGATVVPVYFVWITPELFNFSLACLAYFCWLYKEVASPVRTPKGTRWLFSDRERRRRRDPAWHRDVLQAVECAAVRADCHLADGWTATARAGDRERGDLRARDRRAVRHQHGDLRRLELPGRARSADLLFRVSVPESDADQRHRHAEGARRGADGHHLQPARLCDEPAAQPRLCVSSAAMPALSPISSRLCSR